MGCFPRIGHAVEVGVKRDGVTFYHTQEGVGGDCVRTHKERVHAAEGEVVLRVDDAQFGCVCRTYKNGVDDAGSFVQQAGIFFVQTRQLCSSTSANRDKRIVGALQIEFGRGVLLFEDIQLVVLLVAVQAVQRESAGTHTFLETPEVAVVDLLEAFVRPEVVGGIVEFVAGLKLVSAQVPTSVVFLFVALHEIARTEFGCQCGRSGPEVVVNHVDMIISHGFAELVLVDRGVILAAVERVGFAPVVDDVVGELAVHKRVVVVVSLVNLGVAANTVETRCAVEAIGDETMVHGAVLASPLRRVRATTFFILAVVESFADNRPLDCCGVGVIGGDALFHGPCEGTVVDDDVAGVLHIQCRATLGHHVACTETDMTDDDVGLADVEVVARQADSSARGALARDGDVGVLEFEYTGEVDRSADLEEDGSRGVVAVAQRPAESALNEVVVGTIIEASDVIDVSSATSGHKLTIAFRAGKGGQQLRRSRHAVQPYQYACKNQFLYHSSHISPIRPISPINQ